MRVEGYRLVREWLDGFNTFSIYQVLPQIIELWGLNTRTEVQAKKLRRAGREMTPPLFLRRCVRLGLSIRDLDLLSIGLINDMYGESRNDENKYAVMAVQDDFDKDINIPPSWSGIWRLTYRYSGLCNAQYRYGRFPYGRPDGLCR